MIKKRVRMLTRFARGDSKFLERSLMIFFFQVIDYPPCRDPIHKPIRFGYRLLAASDQMHMIRHDHISEDWYP